MGENKLLAILNYCNNTQEELINIKNMMYVLQEGFRSCGFECVEHIESAMIIFENLLDNILEEYLDPLETLVCEIGNFEK